MSRQWTWAVERGVARPGEIRKTRRGDRMRLEIVTPSQTGGAAEAPFAV